MPGAITRATRSMTGRLVLCLCTFAALAGCGSSSSQTGSTTATSTGAGASVVKLATVQSCLQHAGYVAENGAAKSDRERSR